MISLVFVFYVFVGLAAVIGAVRGWAKETLVLISALLAIFIIYVFEAYVPIYRAIVFPVDKQHQVAAGDNCDYVADVLGTTVPKMLAANKIEIPEGEECRLPEGKIMIYKSMTSRFWASTGIILVLAFFGYQTPAMKIFQAGARREKVRDAVLGGVFGAANGYLIFGSIWYFLENAGYENFSRVMVAPEAGTQLAETATNLLTRMPPVFLLNAPVIFITIALAFVFVVIVYV